MPSQKIALADADTATIQLHDSFKRVATARLATTQQFLEAMAETDTANFKQLWASPAYLLERGIVIDDMAALEAFKVMSTLDETSFTHIGFTQVRDEHNKSTKLAALQIFEHLLIVGAEEVPQQLKNSLACNKITYLVQSSTTLQNEIVSFVKRSTEFVRDRDAINDFKNLTETIAVAASFSNVMSKELMTGNFINKSVTVMDVLEKADLKKAILYKKAVLSL